MRKLELYSNRLKVLKAINAGPIPRSLLAARTGLSHGTTSQVTADLLRLGFVIERRDETPRIGRPLKFLEIDPTAAVVLGASVAAEGHLTATFVCLGGRVLASDEVYISKTPASLEAVAGDIADGLAQVIAKSGVPAEKIASIAVSLPALVDGISGEVHFITSFPSGRVPFAQIIEERLGRPVTVESDMACLARAEHWSGRAANLNTFTLFHVGSGLGSAQYRDGLPVSGANGFTPWIGHTKIMQGPNARQCYCGGVGCASAYVSTSGILLEAGMLSDELYPSKNLGKLFQAFLDRADAGDVEARRILDSAGYHLGVFVANHLNAADPGCVVLLVPDARYASYIKPQFDSALESNALPGLTGVTRIEIAVASDDWRQKGTAALALEQLFLDEVRPYSRSAARKSTGPLEAV